MFLNPFCKLRPEKRPSSLIRPQVSRLNERPAWLRRSPGFYGVILLVGIFAVAWAFFSQRYYAWSLGSEIIDVVVFCDTADLNDPGLKAVVLYDQIALTPIARALGLYQNRPPDKVRVFFPLPVRRYTMTPFSITLHGVPTGPIARIVFIAQGRHFHVPVSDRRIIKGALYIRVTP